MGLGVLRDHPCSMRSAVGSPTPGYGHPKAQGYLFPHPLTLLCVLQVFGVHLNKWQLDKKLGCGCLFLYGVFLCFSIMTEFNVFTFVNLPMCGDH